MAKAGFQLSALRSSQEYVPTAEWFSPAVRWARPAFWTIGCLPTVQAAASAETATQKPIGLSRQGSIPFQPRNSRETIFHALRKTLETVIGQAGSYKTVLPLHQSFEGRPMFEVAIAVIAAISLSIFLVHAVEAYLTH